MRVCMCVWGWAGCSFSRLLLISADAFHPRAPASPSTCVSPLSSSLFAAQPHLFLHGCVPDRARGTVSTACTSAYILQPIPRRCAAQVDAAPLWLPVLLVCAGHC